MYKFRELFQSRFKTSISVADLHEMKDICTIIGNKNEEYITLRSELIDSIESSELMECFQHSVPYCTAHFLKTHRGKCQLLILILSRKSNNKFNNFLWSFDK